MEQEHSGLLIAALVAIVAVVGLVILFKGGGAEGAAVCGPGQDLQALVNPNNGQNYYACAPSGPVRRIPASANEAAEDNTLYGFQTHYEGGDRRYQIAQRDWEY